MSQLFGTDWRAATLTIVLLVLASCLCHAQTLTVALSSNAVNFNLTSGSAANAGSTSITVTTTCGCVFRTVSVYGYFNNAATALTDGFGDSIPSSAFEISTGGPFNALTNTTPFGGAGAGIQLSQFFVFFPGFGSPHNDTMNFNIDLSPLPSLPSGTYTGTLNIRAQSL